MTKRTQLPGRTGGFTLAELAIVVLISGILLTAGLQMLIARMEAAQLDTTRKHQETIKQALIAYLGQMKRLPCPDTNVDGVENRDTPATPAPCNAYIGTVPYRDLGLDRSIALDGFENFISYVVSPAPVATPPVAPAPPAPPWTTAWLYSYTSTTPVPPALQARETNLGANAFWPTTSTGGIEARTVNATGAVAVIANPTDSPPSGAVVVLISHGKNGYGARNVTGNQNDLAAAGADEQQNASPVSGGTPRSVVVFSRDITDADPGGSGHGPFDDLVMTIRRDDLIGPLVTSGVLQANPLAAFSQAQDLVMGRLLATRACNSTPPPPCTTGYSFSWPPGESYTSTPWNIRYALVPNPPGPPFTLDSATPAGPAYTLTAEDGTVRTVSVDEVKGIIARNGLF